MRLLLPVMFLLGGLLAPAAELYFEADFDEGDTPAAGGRIVSAPGRGGVLQVEVSADSPQPHGVHIPLPIDQLRGKRVFFGADVRGEGISGRPKAWNGVKVMLVIESPSGTTYPQPEVPTGSFGWKRFTRLATIPADATAATLTLGLEQVTGRVWFDQVRVTHQASVVRMPAADPSQPVFRGHKLPRLRGAMAGQRVGEADIKDFADSWGGNLLRWQLFEAARQDRPLDQYGSWLDGELEYLDGVLEWCRQHGVMIALDLHSPPGGEAFSAGYITARGDIFRKPAAQAMFVEVWRKIARRYRGNPVIWGFDLLNEPDDSMLAEGCDDWRALATRAARAVREIDPERTLIVEPNQWGGAAAYATFQPLEVANCVYSFHMYAPHQFTHQAIHGNPGGIRYPGTVAGEHWDQAALRRHMEPAIAFAERYRVHMYVGEFSAIRIAPDGSAARYLSDLTALLEELGYDWSYHAYREWQGWSLEHEGPLDQPRAATVPTDRQEAVTRWFQRNERPQFGP